MAKYQRRRKTIHKNYHNGAVTHQKEGNRFPCSPLRNAEITVFRLLKITLQQALQRLAMPGLVPGHLMYGVVDGVQVVLLGAGGQIELTLGGAELAVHAPGQVLLGVGGHVGLQVLAQQLGELGGVLSLLVGGLKEIRRQVVRLKKIGKTGKGIEELTGVRQNRASKIWTAYQREGETSLERKNMDESLEHTWSLLGRSKRLSGRQLKRKRCRNI